MKGQSFEEFIAEEPEEGRRRRDLALLDALVEIEVFDADEFDEAAAPHLRNDALSEDEHDAFSDMLEPLKNGQRVLTEKQRAWAERRAGDLGIETDEDPAERNRDVPRGREVALVVDEMPRPKRPPGRR